MNLKFFVTLALVILAVMFAPLIPNDISLECSLDVVDCDDVSQYVSLYEKYIK